MATTSALVTRLETRFDDTGHAIYSAANWLSYLNDAYSWMSARLPWGPWKEKRTLSLTVTANSDVVDLPADGWRVTFVDDTTDGYQLQPFRSRTQVRRVMAQGETGPPLYYRFLNQQLQVFPTPTVNTTLTLYYYGPLTALDTGGTNNPVIPDEHEQLLLEYALFLAYTDDEDLQRAQLHQASALDALDALIADLGSNRAEGNPILVDDWYDC